MLPIRAAKWQDWPRLSAWKRMSPIPGASLRESVEWCFFKPITQKRNLDFGVERWSGKQSAFNQIAFLIVSTDRLPVGQQHRVQAKRKRRRAYLERKKTALRTSAAQPVSGKQRAKKEPATEE